MAFDDFFGPQSLALMWQVLLKMTVAVTLAGFIGWEREKHGRPAGIRTHMLVGLGVVLFSEVSRVFTAEDPSRIAAQVVTGIGFLGAGTIMRLGPEVKGLTTAASIWATAGIAMAVSVGGFMIIVASIATVMALFTLSVVETIENKIAAKTHSRTMICAIESRTGWGLLLQALEKANITVKGIRFTDSDDATEATISLSGDRAQAIDVATSVKGVRWARWSD